MSTQSIIHQQSHLYPCQLSTIRSESTQQEKFMFYSSLNNYCTVYDPSSQQCDFVDLEGVQYQKIQNFSLSSSQRCIAMNSTNQVKFVTNGITNLLPIRMRSNSALISDQINIAKSFNMSELPNRNHELNIAYLTMDDQKEANDIYLNISSFNRIQPQIETGEDKLNPETDQQFDSQKYIKCNDLNESFTYQNNQNYSTQLKLPSLGSDKSYRSSSFQLIQSKCSDELVMFQKQSSTAYFYDSEYEAVPSMISCNSDSQFQLMTTYEANNISLLSENLLVNSYCNGIIKLLDRRVNRVVQVRNLMEEISLFNDRPFTQRQQNVIKFWNDQKTQTIDEAFIPTSSFLINLKNQIYEVDLRNSRLNPESFVFKFDSSQQIGNYEMHLDGKSRVTAFTTEGHSKFKGYVVEEITN